MSKRHHSKLRAAARHLRFACQAHLVCLLAGAILASSSAALLAAECVAQSSRHRVALLELYTSEGCNSCPPADRWLNGIQDRGIDTGQLVPLAFHVDYWDYIGWKDRFAQPAFSERQRRIAARNRASFIYTPQFILDGRDYRRASRRGDLAERLATINDEPAAVSLHLQQARSEAALKVSLRGANAGVHDANVFVALFQNGLHSAVKSGENAGKKLYHEFVVRELKGPFALRAGAHWQQPMRFDLTPYRPTSSVGIAVFAENPVSGQTMQALAVPVCPASP